VDARRNPGFTGEGLAVGIIVTDSWMGKLEYHLPFVSFVLCPEQTAVAGVENHLL